MARLKCMFKWKDKSVRWQDKSKWQEQKCTFKWQDKVYV